MRTLAQKIGDYHEDCACQIVQANQLTIIARNYHASRLGEIDIIAEERTVNRLGKANKTLVFIEVRARKSGKFASSLESITPAKQRKIIAAATHFLAQNPDFCEHDCRFDVIAFDNDGQGKSDGEWIKSAFLATE